MISNSVIILDLNHSLKVLLIKDLYCCWHDYWPDLIYYFSISRPLHGFMVMASRLFQPERLNGGKL